jgi:NAD(P)-dependent dehydrogenase (short-subunit alcohol dehydrogenase family)
MLLKDKVAVVTGGAKGMGKGIVLKFAEEGCDLVIPDLDIDSAQKVANEVESMGRKAMVFKVDISNRLEVENMAHVTIEKFGTIDILVNNAGGVGGIKGAGSSDDIFEEDWDRIIDVNLKGAFLVTMAVLPIMKKNCYGKIINLSSMGAIHPAVSVVHYHAAKGGILALTTNLAFELAPKNIYVNAIIPGPIETSFWDNLMPPGPEREAFLAAIAEKEVPIGRVGKPGDIAGPALFLASELSDYVTGQFIRVGGGLPLLSHNAIFNIEAYLREKPGTGIESGA